MKYRHEIDGLRAVAVTSVLIFHFFPTYLPLGYLGVDLFFVISGFLIGHYILEQKQANTFSYKTFYWRRIKRILPVTLTVLTSTTIFAFMFLLPPDIIKYAYSLLSTITFTANIYFWRAGGYFGTADELKPLLHMWSLGVEEQFYLFFPFIFSLIISVLRRVKFIGAAVLLIVLLSFVLNMFFQKIGGANPAFFLLPTRVWQFGIGAYAAIVYKNENDIAWSILTPISLLVVLLSFVFPFNFLPSATFSTLALGFFLSKSHSPNSTSLKLLSYPPIRSVGHISFSLYLWHWPIISFLKYYYVGNIPLSILVLGVLTTILLSYLSYYFVEEPFRRKYNKRKVSAFVVITIILTSTLAVVAVFFNGFEARASKLANIISSASQTNYRCPINSYFSYGASRACYIIQGAASDYTIALVGNSHAQMYSPTLSRLLVSKNMTGILIPLNGCLPTTDINTSVNCLRLANANFETYINDGNIEQIIFATTWSADEYVTEDGVVLVDPSKLLIANSLLALVKKVEQSGREAFLIGPIQTPGWDITSELSRNLHFNIISETDALTELKRPRTEFETQFGDAVAYLLLNLGTKFALPHSLLCDEHFCYFGGVDGMFFADSNHLSEKGALLMAPVFEAMLEN